MMTRRNTILLLLSVAANGAAAVYHYASAPRFKPDLKTVLQRINEADSACVGFGMELVDEPEPPWDMQKPIQCAHPLRGLALTHLRAALQLDSLRNWAATEPPTDHGAETQTAGIDFFVFGQPVARLRVFYFDYQRTVRVYADNQWIAKSSLSDAASDYVYKLLLRSP